MKLSRFKSGAADFVGTEVRVREHGDFWLLSKEFKRLVREFGNVDECLGIGVSVDKRVGLEECTFGSRDDVHGSEMGVPFPYSDNIFGDLYRFGVFGISTGNESIGIAAFYHHHTEIVAVIHFFIRFVGSDPFSLSFVGQYLGIVMTAFGFGTASQVDDFDAVETEAEITSEIFDKVGITQ